MRNPRKILAVALGLALAMVACSAEEEATTAQETSAASRAASPSETPVTGGIAVTVQALQETLPNDIRMYPAASLTAAQKLPTKRSGEVGVTMQTNDSVEDVVDYYRDAAKKDDWNIELEHLDEMSGALEARKGDRTLAVLTVANGVDPTAIMVKVIKNAP